MKRAILSMTTAIALTLPAVAQTTDVDETVMSVLASNGYPESSFELLTEAEIANIYVTSTSGDANDLDTVLAGIDLPSDEGSDLLRRSGEPSDVELAVRDVLDEEGYDPDMIAALSSGDIANIYTASTSGSSFDVERAVASAVEASMTLSDTDPSNAERRAMMYLADQGYTDAQIDMVDQTELLSIYVALTSNDSGELQRTIDAAIAS